MITAINSATSFKAFYKPNNYQFSDSQQAVIKDIVVKLGDRTREKDYCVTPYGENSVALYKVSQPRTSLQDPKSMRFDKMGLCAVCDEWHPLDIKKLDDAQKTLDHMCGCLYVALCFMLVTMAAALVAGGVHLLKGNKQLTKAQTEFVQKADSLKYNLIKSIK